MTPSVTLFDVKPLMDHLSSGRLVLTSNQRLASRISTAYAQNCNELGLSVVASPRVYAINHWIEQGWKRLLITGDSLALQQKPLSNFQEQQLWEQVISTTSSESGEILGSALLRPSSAAKITAGAYKLLVEWRQDISDEKLRVAFQNDEDASALLAWIDAFEKRCKDNKWMASCRNTERVLSAYETGVLASEGEIVGIGFEDMPPLLMALVQSAGQFEHYERHAAAGDVSITSCDSADQEIVAAAIWAKQVLKNQTDASVAIVIPALSEQRQSVQRVLQEVFAPDHSQPVDKNGVINRRKNLPFNFSAGYPLIEAPVIRAALDALSLASRSIELDTLLGLCQSPFYCLVNEDSDRISTIITALYHQRETEISTARFRQIVERVSADSNQLNDLDHTEPEEWPFASALQNIAALTAGSASSRLRPIEEWLDLFNKILSAVGWPGNRKLDSVEYQQASQWQQAMKSLAAQQLVVGPLYLEDAIYQLRSILTQIIFQPQSSDSSLQVLGTLEAAGLQFTHLWLMSMSDKQWPSAPSPNPLLPYALQRELAMPHATAERELGYAQNLSSRFIHSAQHIVVSSPNVIDETPAAISSLFKGYQKKTLNEVLGRGLIGLTPKHEIRLKHFESKREQDYQAGDAPNVTEEETIRGGSNIFASQSACPFRAYASHRLGLQSLPESQLGLNAADRGSLLHRALELIWQKLKTQQVLLLLGQDEQEKLCAEVSRYTLEEFCQARAPSMGLRYKQLEISRIERLLADWLDVEKERTNFEVEMLEGKKQFHFDKLKIEARIDRIDRLDDGSMLIIDYKTGKSSVSKWWGDRPDEPQLPLYSMLIDTEGKSVGGIAFGQVRAEKCQLIGVGSDQQPEPTLRWQVKNQTDSGATDWDQLKQHWIKTLTELANDFIQGKAHVDPKSVSLSCQYCDFSSICRVGHKKVESV